MANVHGNYGFNANSVFEKLDKYLNKKGSDLDKLSAEQLTSIFEATEKNEDELIRKVKCLSKENKQALLQIVRNLK